VAEDPQQTFREKKRKTSCWRDSEEKTLEKQYSHYNSSCCLLKVGRGGEGYVLDLKEGTRKKARGASGDPLRGGEGIKTREKGQGTDGTKKRNKGLAKEKTK